MNKCPYEVKTCKCQTCRKSASWPGCKSGYCIDCFECEEAGEAIHNIYVCTGYEPREDGDGDG